MKRKRRKMKNQYKLNERVFVPEKSPEQVLMMSRILVAATRPATKTKPDRVEITVTHLNDVELPFPLVAQFDTSESLKSFIEELIAYRNIVFPESEPVDPKATASKSDPLR